MQRHKGIIAFAFLAITFAGCLSDDSTGGTDLGKSANNSNPDSLPGGFVTAEQAIEIGLVHRISSTNASGPEPSIGVTSDGCIFVTAGVATNLLMKRV
jgi:hypothetical protein